MHMSIDMRHSNERRYDSFFRDMTHACLCMCEFVCVRMRTNANLSSLDRIGLLIVHSLGTRLVHYRHDSLI